MNSVKHKAAGHPPAPSWHELVQPPADDARVSPKRHHERLQRRAEHAPKTGPAEVKSSVTYTSPLGDGRRRERREIGNRSREPGRLVLHRTRVTARSGGGIDRTMATHAAKANRAARIAARLNRKQVAA